MKNVTTALLFLSHSLLLQAQDQLNDTTKIHGTTSISGLLQSGNENRFVVSLLSDLNIGNRNYEILPLTSVAYSSKPHAQVEGEYLENVIIRFQQEHLFYPAAGLSFERSLLRKIDDRFSIGVTLVCNLLNSNNQTIKLGLGVNEEYTRYSSHAFADEALYGVNYRRKVEQAYARLKGKNYLLKKMLALSYDFFFQPNITQISDYRWTLIGNIDILLNNRFSFRTSAVDSYEAFTAAAVQHNNFRLTFGLNLTF